jgi:hypothetical protein
VGAGMLPFLLSYYLDMDDVFTSIFNTFTAAFSTKNESGEVRLQQSIALINGFFDFPLFGNGLNSFPKNNIRNSESPWSYEMVYLALLFQTGLSGLFVFSMYCYKTAHANFCMFKKSTGTNKNFFLGVFAGFIAFVFAGSSNPMIYFIWFWSISLIAFNRFKDNVPL